MSDPYPGHIPANTSICMHLFPSSIRDCPGFDRYSYESLQVWIRYWCSGSDVTRAGK